MALTLSRKEQESVVVFTSSNEQIEITITKIDSNQVRLSFAGPDTIDIWRSELLQIQGDEDEKNGRARNFRLNKDISIRKIFVKGFYR